MSNRKLILLVAAPLMLGLLSIFATALTSSPVPLIDFSQPVFKDEFDTLDFGDRDLTPQSWYNGLWYEKPNPLDQMSVEGGVLTLKAPPGKRSTSITTVPRHGKGGRVFKHGYFEARMRFANSDNDWAAFWLFSWQHSQGTDNNHWCEIDVFEHFGPGKFVGSVHEWTDKSHSRNSNAISKVEHPIDFSEWHNYGLLWTQSRLIWFLDGKPVHEAPPPQVCNNQDMFVILGTSKHEEGPLAWLQVDWLRIWSQRRDQRNSVQK
ncbi:glycoside hydrolase family 16 protein [Bradyrhizobium sp. CCBAU 21359]|uniref:glycoside hydrolase family 16 protein n=1 Tax=Bradyrhizobium sp. CCBAU 21359 TaxID=1325080 RepID=UPI002304E504|nr:glycoside hydrolase family 16 protein [Bradyrhizobium sp. CCBAU 21359]